MVVCKLFSIGRTIKNCLLVLDGSLRGKQIFGKLLSSIDFIWSDTLPPPIMYYCNNSDWPDISMFFPYQAMGRDTVSFEKVFGFIQSRFVKGPWLCWTSQKLSTTGKPSVSTSTWFKSAWGRYALNLQNANLSTVSGKFTCSRCMWVAFATIILVKPYWEDLGSQESRVN